MSSLHQSRLLVEGPEPVKGPRVTLATTRRNTGRTTGDKVTSTVPAQRQGKSQRTGTPPTIDAATPRAVAREVRAPVTGSGPSTRRWSWWSELMHLTSVGRHSDTHPRGRGAGSM